MTHHTTESVERTMTGETVHGIPVRAYVQDVDTPMGTADRFCSHWSTPGAGAKNLTRLFAEDDVLALVAERDALRARLDEAEARMAEIWNIETSDMKDLSDFGIGHAFRRAFNRARTIARAFLNGGGNG